MKLSELSPGDFARISQVGQIDLPAVVKRKLLSMGITPNTRFSLIRRAPMGSGVELDIRGSKLCMRRDLADIIEVEKSNG
ncbi:ferrous iron transport protein A [Shewanella sp. Choline-02u-19]|jgi:ferrous iron transport protein A|uniref:FeoA family protein n=1 Tax=Shewanella TaxID=22 RepID=UPI000C3385F8|nr:MULTISPECIES: FeoA family protein [Shewanella]MCL1059843.1 ferrous iron transport protein A [Shewanella gelidimarina]PKG58118.1 ferrous iron transport protein A [Shewanella sp. GutDb-MelDb]PKG73531.1 ferrous iron transport protein A [Shewanella sp. GutCb]PKH53700.1 ferrous iron transport protein A [Shewanella sp. Bg11-22]PKI28128.1 ferrous iron transport protein A [Shewanella sp. Choline-02u-19]